MGIFCYYFYFPKIKNVFCLIFLPFQTFWNTFLLWFLTKSSLFCFVLGGGGTKIQKSFWPIFSPFQAILNNFDFFHFWPKFFYGQQKKNVGGAKSPKIIFDQFCLHFRQFRTTLIFFIFDKHFFIYLFFGGAGSV